MGALTATDHTVTDFTCSITIVSMVRLYTMKVFNFSKNPTRKFTTTTTAPPTAHLSSFLNLGPTNPFPPYPQPIRSEIKLTPAFVSHTGDFVNLSLWSAIEIYVSIICACLPGTRNFYNRVILGKLLGKGRFASRWPLQHNYSPSPVSVTSAKFPMNPTANQHALVGVARTNSASSSSSASDAGSYSHASHLEKGSLKEFVLVVDGPVPMPARNIEGGRGGAAPVLSDIDMAYHWNRSHPPTPSMY